MFKMAYWQIPLLFVFVSILFSGFCFFPFLLSKQQNYNSLKYSWIKIELILNIYETTFDILYFEICDLKVTASKAPFVLIYNYLLKTGDLQSQIQIIYTTQ